MTRFFSRLALGAAALSLLATPAMARDHWGHRHHRGNGVTTSGVITGLLVLGGIAAIASAASKSNNSGGGDYRDYPGSEPYPDNRPVYQERSGAQGNGIDNAVDQCVGEVERGQDRVAAVDNAARTANGWRISGQLEAGRNFSCSIDNDGRIRSVDLGDGYAYSGADGGGAYDSAAPGQWDDESYARARDQVGYIAP